MDIITLMYIYGGAIVFIIALLLAGPWLVFGYKFVFGKLEYKENAGLLFFQNLSGNVGRPIMVDISKGEYVLKDKKTKTEKKYYFSRESFRRDTTFFGLPYVIFSQDDTLTTAGIYFQENTIDPQSKQPTPVYFRTAEGDKIPHLRPLKPSITLPPDMIKASVISQNLKQILSEVLLQYKTVFLIVAGIGIGIAIMLFFQYNMVSETFPMQEQLLRDILANTAQCVPTIGGQ